MVDKKKKILFLHVDDEPDTLSVVKTILEIKGYEVSSVESGKAALEQIEHRKFDLILLDIMMPDMSGWELFTRISKIDPKYKVIFLTVLEISEERLKQLKERGIKDYITKPFDRDELVEKVEHALSD